MPPREPGTVFRLDFAPIRGATITSQGFLRFDAALGRTGVLTYQTPDGPRRELRPPEEVFAPSAMASAAGAVVTDLHPPREEAWITPSNWKKWAVGAVGDQVRQDGKHLRGTVTVSDAAMIELVKTGKRKEISPGYVCRIENSAGRWDGTEYGPDVTGGEAYDCIQRGIVHNSIGLGPDGWGRQGSAVALRLDSLEEAAAVLAASSILDELPKREDPISQRGKMDTVEIHLDGLTIMVPKASEQWLRKAVADRDAALATATKAMSELQGRFDGQADKLAAAEKAIAELPSKIKGELISRATLEAIARRVLGAEAKLDGKTDREVREMALAKAAPKAELAGKDDAYVNARFDAALEDYQESGASTAARAGLFSVPRTDKAPRHLVQKQDAGEDDPSDAEASRRRLHERNRKAWQPNPRTA